ncbi:MAG: AmmeMemoRadiSam system radical SAM enzyme [Proteobacteria bacterium]|nr:AmmeMemoRadiSam system radical SAM enzyme [Pseudomonadota bacterium]MBU1744077.1 AmmeMemoRadiSam system radical SAM enzyme [Pseudomonadota bacterium]MCG2740797.1 AmmeMemoRadiSam system radical SAM enzyme [Syntrophaceae bacterium]
MGGEGGVGRKMTKRDFLRFCGAGVCLVPAASLLGFPKIGRAQLAKKGLIKTKPASHFTQMEGGEIRCELCPRRCRVPKGSRGFCRVRENRDGKYYSLVYGNPCAVNLDPIEKKPFFHVLPGTTSFSLATAGCNFHCKFCQNWAISQASPEDLYNYDFPPELVVKKAREMRARSVAYTYVEPVIFFEYMLDTGRLVKEAGLLNVCHSNGFINPAPLRDLCRVLSAANIDLKGFSDSFYRKLCGGELNPVLETLKTLKREKIHLEITNLVIPTENDQAEVLKAMCLWVKKELGADTPLHFSRFYPLYKLQSLPPTPVSTLERARSIALAAGLEYVYIGNVPGHEGENTFCPNCTKKIIRRTGYMVGEMHLNNGKCGYCGKPIPGIWA